MSKAEQYEIAIAAIIAGIFGPVLFQRYLEGTFNTREQWTLGIILVCVSIYGLLRLYIAYRRQQESAQSNTPATRGTSRSSVHTPPRWVSRETVERLSDNEPPAKPSSDNDDDESASQQNKKSPR